MEKRTTEDYIGSLANKAFEASDSFKGLAASVDRLIDRIDELERWVDGLDDRVWEVERG